MDSNDKETDALLETIKKELNMIINSEPEAKPPTAKQESSKTPGKQMKKGKSTETLPREPEPETNFDIDTGKGTQNIDEDVQKMRIDLEKSYELFQNIGEKFETINFNSLKNRIKDLHLNDSSLDIGRGTAAELKKMFEDSFINNNLSSLTKDMGQRLKAHPGEFGDIPELSAFFQACTRLQHGLEDLKKKREEVHNLAQRMAHETEISYSRVDEIRKLMDNKK